MKTQCFSLGSELHKDEVALKNYLVTCNDSFELSIKGSSSLRHPTPALLPGKSHGQRSLVGRSPWGHYESDTTERLHFYFLLSCIGEGNGNPLQCSCLESPRDRGAWWAAVYGVTQSRTRLKRLSSSRSILIRQFDKGNNRWSVKIHLLGIQW